MKTQAPRITFEALDDEYLEKGVNLTDLNNSLGGPGCDGHFEAWHKSKGLPKHDEKGVHFRSSKEHYAQYQQDPEGEAKRPLYVNLWHYLLMISESIKWNEGDSERSKSMPLAKDVLFIRPAVEENEIGELRKRIEENAPIPDAAFQHYLDSRRIQHLQDIEARKLTLRIIEEKGVEVPNYGKILFVEMKVEC